jgi:hypothetical protein
MGPMAAPLSLGMRPRRLPQCYSRIFCRHVVNRKPSTRSPHKCSPTYNDRRLCKGRELAAICRGRKLLVQVREKSRLTVYLD